MVLCPIPPHKGCLFYHFRNGWTSSSSKVLCILLLFSQNSISIHSKYSQQNPTLYLQLFRGKSHYLVPLLLLHEVSILIPLAWGINIWTASTSEHSSPMLLSCLQIHAHNCQLSKWCWLYRLKRESREETSPKNRHNTQSFEKEHLCQCYYLATGSSSLQSIFFNTATLSTVP